MDGGTSGEYDHSSAAPVSEVSLSLAGSGHHVADGSAESPRDEERLPFPNNGGLLGQSWQLSASTEEQFAPHPDGGAGLTSHGMTPVNFNLIASANRHAGLRGMSSLVSPAASVLSGGGLDPPPTTAGEQYMTLPQFEFRADIGDPNHPIKDSADQQCRKEGSAQRYLDEGEM